MRKPYMFKNPVSLLSRVFKKIFYFSWQYKLDLHGNNDIDRTLLPGGILCLSIKLKSVVLTLPNYLY